MGYNKRFIDKEKEQMIMDHTFIKALKLELIKKYIKK
jgi:hypothetical protein